MGSKKGIRKRPIKVFFCFFFPFGGISLRDILFGKFERLWCGFAAFDWIWSGAECELRPLGMPLGWGLLRFFGLQGELKGGVEFSFLRKIH